MIRVKSNLPAEYTGNQDNHDQNVNDDSFIKGKAESIIEYLTSYVDNVEDGDLTIEEVTELISESGAPEGIAENIFDRLAEDNSRLNYDNDDIYEIAKIIRKKDISKSVKSGDSLNDKKAAAILEYIIDNCDEVEEGDVTTDEITKILDNAENQGVDDTATEILDYVAEENSRFDYTDNDVYEIARIVRKRRM